MDHATYVAIREKHIALIHTIDELKASIQAPETSAQTLQRLSETLRDRISDRFTEEQEHALFQHLLQSAPRLQREIEALEGDHEELRLQLEALLRLFDATGEVDRSRFADQFSAFLQHFSDHERREDDLIQEVYDDDLGSSD